MCVEYVCGVVVGNGQCFILCYIQLSPVRSSSMSKESREDDISKAAEEAGGILKGMFTV